MLYYCREWGEWSKMKIKQMECQASTPKETISSMYSSRIPGLQQGQTRSLEEAERRGQIQWNQTNVRMDSILKAVNPGIDIRWHGGALETSCGQHRPRR